MRVGHANLLEQRLAGATSWYLWVMLSALTAFSMLLLRFLFCQPALVRFLRMRRLATVTGTAVLPPRRDRAAGGTVTLPGAN